MPFAIGVRVPVTLAALGLIAGCTGGGTPARPPHAARHHQITAARHHQITTASGRRVVSYHGVHVTVPAGWPVVDGAHTLICWGPFPSTPTVFTGPQIAGGPYPSCPAPVGRTVRRDGVWLQPGSAPSGARPVRTGAGLVVLEERQVNKVSPAVWLWYHRVFIQVGIGPDPAVARSIINSVGFTPGVPDTHAAGVCPRSAGPPGMPRPERLTRRLVVDQGDITLAPPRRSDRPVMPAAQAWARSSSRSPFERYRLMLTRYSSKFPARQNANGSYTPTYTDVLAWAVYTMPYGAPIAGCGWWELDAFNATTGRGIETDSWSPGP